MRIVVVLLMLLASTAHAIGNGSVTGTPAVSFITSSTGDGTANTTLKNTTAASINVELTKDGSCDPDIDFSVGGGTTFSLGPSATKTVTFTCSSAHVGMERCVVHARDSVSHDPLVDVVGVCEHASSTSLLTTQPTLAFGPVAVGDSATLSLGITNSGGTDISRLAFQTDELDGNFAVSIPCNPDSAACDGKIAPLANGGTQTVLVKCSPTSAGSHTAHLEVASDADSHTATKVTLTCTGTAATVPVFGVTPLVASIGAPVEVRSGSAQTTVYVQNLGTGTLAIDAIHVQDEDAGASGDWQFAVSGTCTLPTCSLGAGQMITIDLTFDPNQIALRRASLVFSFTDTISHSRSIPLNASSTGATLALVDTPSAIDFGTVPIGKSSLAPLFFFNTGNRDTPASIAISPTGPFSLDQPTLIVTPNARATLMATCTPTAPGTAPAMIVASDMDTITDTTLSIGAACTGSTTPLYADPSVISLGEVRSGMSAMPAVTTIMIASTGAPLTLMTPHLDTANASITLGALSSTTTPATFDVTVTPDAEVDLADHIIVSDTTGDTIEIALTGKVVKPAFDPLKALDIGTFCVGQPTTGSPLSLNVTGSATIDVMAPSVTETSGFDIDFVSPTTYPMLVPPNKSATVSVTPRRQNAVIDLSTTLSWPTDIADSGNGAALVSARFIDKGGAISPRGVDFGSQTVHLATDEAKTITLQNCNTTTLELDPPTINPPFYISSPSFPTSLEPAEAAVFSVGFQPTRLGTYDDVLTITSPQLPDAPLTVSLHGVSVNTGSGDNMDAGMDTTEPGTTTFYACSCKTSSPSGVAPILIAFVLIVRRRSGSS
ncbi:MAG: choice-of-anchor D domain-containing protein [Kofleriaceae bacterium]